MNKEQIELIEKLDLGFLLPDDLSRLPVENINKLGDAVSDYFQLHGIDADNEVNEIGHVCESIMDIIGYL